MFDGIKFRKLSQQHLDYLWQNLRKADRDEFIAYGHSDDSYRDILASHTELICALHKGKPFCAWGHSNLINAVQFAFLGTDEVANWWDQITHVANIYIRKTLRANFPKMGTIWVYENHKQSRHWITKHLGFADSGQVVDMRGNRFLIYRRGIGYV